jgi:hypothetical protein
MTEGEIEMLAGSCALDLGNSRKALAYFDAARTADYSSSGYVRDNAHFLTRRADARLALGEIDEACTTACHAFNGSGGVDSTRPSGAIGNFRDRLRHHQRTPAAADFLDLTA